MTVRSHPSHLLEPSTLYFHFVYPAATRNARATAHRYEVRMTLKLQTEAAHLSVSAGSQYVACFHRGATNRTAPHFHACTHTNSHFCTLRRSACKRLMCCSSARALLCAQQGMKRTDARNLHRAAKHPLHVHSDPHFGPTS